MGSPLSHGDGFITVCGKTVSERCVRRDSKELVVGSSFYADRYGPWKPSGRVHVPVGICFKRGRQLEQEQEHVAQLPRES